jgi:hypothetical protein
MAWLHVPRRALAASSPGEECSTPESTWPAELSLWCTSSEGHLPQPSSWPGWRKRPWARLLCGTTSPPSTLERGVAWWISSLAAAPARTSPSPGSGLASTVFAADSGATNSAFLTRQGLLFSSGKTSAEPSSPRWTWLRTTLASSAIELRLALSALRMSERPTSESDSSSWPTPSAKPYGSNQSPSPGAALRPSPGAALRPSLQSLSANWPTPTATDRKGSGSAAYPATDTHNVGTSLTDAAVRMWPTPASRDWKGAPDEAHDRGTRGAPLNEVAKLWPTPTNRVDGRRGMPSAETAQARFDSGRRNIDDAVALWATPRSSDGRKGGPNARDSSGSLHLVSMAVRHSDSTDSRPDESPGSGTGGMALSPLFVECLMGLPRGWSSPQTALSSSATVSSRSKRRRRSSSAGSDSSEVGE